LVCADALVAMLHNTAKIARGKNFLPFTPNLIGIIKYQMFSDTALYNNIGEWLTGR
jgi:hypothetical protein